MPRYNVEVKKNIWKCFSTIVDDFVTEEMSEEDYQKWRKEQYGVHCGEIRDSNIMSLEEAFELIELTRGD